MYTYQLIPKENIHTIIPLLQILNDSISEKVLQERLTEMVEKGYECAGVYDAIN